MDGPILQLSGIHKSFGGEPALRGAHLELLPGEIHALVGENGAGKSTLINIASGVLRADAGTVTLAGREVAFSSPRHATAAGIAVVHQEADLFAQLSIAENMLLRRGLVRNPLGLVDWNRVYRDAGEMVAAMGERFNIRAPAGGLPVARRMMSEIAAAVSENARVLFLDEPTSSLTLKEIEHLFLQVRKLRDAGVGIVYVSHRLDEVLELCGRVTVMRDGETVRTDAAAELTMDDIVAAMVGREASTIFHKRAVSIGEPRLRIENVTDTEGAFRDVSFEVRSGEILGLYGFVGAGRSELAQALFGLRPLASGRVTIDGRPLSARSPRAVVRQGLAYLPEDRLVQGVFRGHSLRTNASVVMLRALSSGGIVSAAAERSLASGVIQQMNVRATSMEQPIVTLSGGNQQKVVFGRWQSVSPKVLLLDEPTRGVDVGAKGEIHKLICDRAAEGAAIVLVSSELPEIMAMSDRVVTLSEGRVTGCFEPGADSEETIASAAVPRSSGGAAAADSKATSWTDKLLQFREGGLVAFILLLCGVMAVLKPGLFATRGNFLDILANAALPAIMAQGVMLIICAGGIDISIGSMMGLTAALAGLAAKSGYPPLVCLAIAMSVGCALSMLNGATALLARIHPIIVTLAGISIYRGIMRTVTGGREVMNLPDSFRALSDGTLLGVPKIVYYVTAVTLLTHVFLRYTVTGRQVLALGNSESAAKLIGLSKTRLTLTVFAVSGLFVGLTGVLLAGYYGKVQANTGDGWELKAIAAAVIGGTNILGGRGSALGTLLGAILVALLYNMLILMQISSYWQSLFVGGLILLAVTVDVGLQRLRGNTA